MNRVIHFEIHADRPERAIRFYENVFGWKFGKWDPVPAGADPAAKSPEFWLITTGPDTEVGINGSLLRRRGGSPVDGAPTNGYICTIQVTSVDDIAAKVEGYGGKVVLPKMPVPGVGWLAYGKDSEGNIFGFMQDDTTVR